MATKKLAAAFGAVMALAVLAGLSKFFLKESYARWGLRFMEGKVTGPIQGGLLLHWYDARSGGLMYFDEAIIGNMRRDPRNPAQIARATEVLNHFDASKLSHPDQQAVLVERAALSALGGDETRATELVSFYCQNQRPPQGGVPQCMKYDLKFLSEKMGPQEAVYVYATAKLAYSVGSIDRTLANYYMAMSTMFFSPKDSDRFMGEMARNNTLSNEFRASLCSKAANNDVQLRLCTDQTSH